MRSFWLFVIIVGALLVALPVRANPLNLPAQIGKYCVVGGEYASSKGKGVFYFNKGSAMQYLIESKDGNIFTLYAISPSKKQLRAGSKADVVGFFESSQYCQSPSP